MEILTTFRADLVAGVLNEPVFTAERIPQYQKLAHTLFEDEESFLHHKLCELGDDPDRTILSLITKSNLITFSALEGEVDEAIKIEPHLYLLCICAARIGMRGQVLESVIRDMRHATFYALARSGGKW